MNRSPSTVAGVAAIAAGLALLAVIAPWPASGAAAADAATQPKRAPSTVSAGGVTLRSVNVDFPDSDRRFEGPGADFVNNNCLACHSAGMVLTQPRLSRAVWQGEVDKMRNTYKAPVEAADVPAIVDYLATLPR
jgi:cytochrome c5